MKLRRWTRMFGGLLIIALMGMGYVGCSGPATEFIDQPADFTKVSAEDNATPGEFYVMGEVTRPGVYDLTDRPTTITMALAAAGNMSAVAWPEHSVLLRRVGENQEQIIPIDIEKIYRGEETDIVLKAHDVISVGTFATSIHGLPAQYAPHKIGDELGDGGGRFQRW